MFGTQRADMEAVLGRDLLLAELDRLDEADELLHVDLAGRDPDEGMTQVPYEKGALLLRHLEEQTGRARLRRVPPRLLRRLRLPQHHDGGLRRLRSRRLPAADPPAGASVPLEAWIERPGLPPDAPQPASDAFGAVEQQAAAWSAAGDGPPS